MRTTQLTLNRCENYTNSWETAFTDLFMASYVSDLMHQPTISQWDFMFCQQVAILLEWLLWGFLFEGKCSSELLNDWIRWKWWDNLESRSSELLLRNQISDIGIVKNLYSLTMWRSLTTPVFPHYRSGSRHDVVPSSMESLNRWELGRNYSFNSSTFLHDDARTRLTPCANARPAKGEPTGVGMATRGWFCWGYQRSDSRGNNWFKWASNESM